MIVAAGEVDRGRSDVHPFRDLETEQDHHGPAQPRERQIVGVEDGDDHDGADVVGDGEGEQEQLRARRDPIADQGHDAHGERDVGRHRDAPALLGGGAGVERQIDRSRNQHAAQRGDGRQGDGPRVPEFSDHELALDLETDDEEEQRHQPVVDPLDERQIDVEEVVAELDDEACLPQLGIGVAPG